MTILHRWSNRLGITSILSLVSFWTFVHSRIDLDTVPHGVYVEFALTWGAISLSAGAAILAAIGGRKLWLLVLLGPIAGVMLMLSAAA